MSETKTRKIVDPCGKVCGLIAHGEHDREFMEDCLSSHLWENPPLGGQLQKGWYRWTPNSHAEPRDAPVLLQQAEPNSNGAFYATYLDLRR
jgi:hypothetical protein